MTAFVEGFSVTLSPVIIGALRDLTLSYTSGLIFIGACFTFASLCIVGIMIIDSRRASHSTVDAVIS